MSSKSNGVTVFFSEIEVKGHQPVLSVSHRKNIESKIAVFARIIFLISIFPVK